MKAADKSINSSKKLGSIRKPSLLGFVMMLGFANPYVFYGLNSLFGFEYLGSESSNSLSVFLILLSALIYIVFFLSMGSARFVFNYRDILVLIVPLLVSASFFLSTLLRGSLNHVAMKYYISFLGYVVPAIFSGQCVAKCNLFSSFAKWLEILMILLSVTIIQNVTIPLLKGENFSSLGGASYQTMSYMSALALGLNLYFLLCGDTYDRFSIFKVGFYKIVCILLIPNQIVGSIATGGRGGVVLGVTYLCLAMFLSVSSSRSFTKKTQNILLITLPIIMVILIWPFLENTRMFYLGLSRVTLVFSGRGLIDPVGLGGRDILFQESLSLISKRPFLGYGCFGIWDQIDFYPHNLFVDILLHGGILFLGFVAIFIILFCRKLLAEVKRRSELKLAVVILLFPCVMLMFSGTYVESAQLWFVLAFILSSSSSSGLSRKIRRR